MRKAFTLIELLVVIAIIAILAAILFPVFTQAKAAAKKTQAISNAKQTTLASIMYSNDVDDMIHPAQTWGGGGPATVGGVSTSPWTWLVMPYMKNADILMDPQAPGPLAWPAVWPVLVAKAFQPEMGFNVDGLAQVIASTTITHNVQGMTNVANPADTVLYTAKNSRSEVKGLTTPTGFWWFGAGTYNIQLTVQQPYCSPDPTVVCGYDWGSAQFLADTILARKEAAGAYTGAVSMRGTGQMVVSWTDGHVSSKNWGAMTAGTNFGKLANGTWVSGANGLLLQDKTKYLWDIE
ncbi:MAG: prepilin-type N-terminal cleavage/methylation domain-containing protein [Chthonomonas sp.]|nr:prepilin-type N-terminal cleavage/methylation domain-containing protein [Chthonomonas sp.]